MSSNPLATSSAHPVDLVVAMTGSEQITLRGFGAERMPDSWLRPGLRFIAADELPAVALTAVVAQERRMRLLRYATAVVVLVFGISIGNTLPWINTHARTTVAPTAWSAKSVTTEGVWIEERNGPERKTRLIRIGSPMPNGDVLSATLADMRTYVAGASTSMISPSQPTPPPAGP